MRGPIGFAALLLLAVLSSAAARAAEERILDFDSRIEVGVDGTLTVTETIEVMAAGEIIKRGIYRDFPTVNRRPSERTVVVGFDVVEVTLDGEPEPWFTTSNEDGVRVYMGDEYGFLESGRHTYAIMYRTDRQLRLFEDHDELYWNVTGNDWVFAIERASATVSLPAGAWALELTGHTGPRGAQGEDWSARRDDAGRPEFTTTRALVPGEGLTIVVTWPKGFVAEPGILARAGHALRDYPAWFAAGGSLAIMLVYYISVWVWIGIGPGRGEIIPRFKPPRHMSPAAVRYVMRMGFDRKAVGAELVGLAVKGRLTIRDGEDGDYVLKEKSSPAKTALTPGERVLLKSLFEKDKEIGTGGYLLPAVLALETDLTYKHHGAHFEHNMWASVVGMGLLVAATFATVMGAIGGPELYLAALAPGVMLLGSVMLFLFSSLLKAWTKAGRKLVDEIEGFRMYLSMAERERLNLTKPPKRTPELFEKFLPYAMALDVENEWGQQFQGVLGGEARSGGGGYSPSWYRGSRFGFKSAEGGFQSGLVSSLSALMPSTANRG